MAALPLWRPVAFWRSDRVRSVTDASGRHRPGVDSAPARPKLLAHFRDDRIGLHVHLGGVLFAATADLYRLNPHPGPEPAALFARFLGWSRPGRT